MYSKMTDGCQREDPPDRPQGRQPRAVGNFLEARRERERTRPLGEEDDAAAARIVSRCSLQLFLMPRIIPKCVNETGTNRVLGQRDI